LHKYCHFYVHVFFYALFLLIHAFHDYHIHDDDDDGENDHESPHHDHGEKINQTIFINNPINFHYELLLVL